MRFKTDSNGAYGNPVMSNLRNSSVSESFCAKVFVIPITFPRSTSLIISSKPSGMIITPKWHAHNGAHNFSSGGRFRTPEFLTLHRHGLHSSTALQPPLVPGHAGGLQPRPPRH